MRFGNVKLLQVLYKSPYTGSPYPWTEATADEATAEQEPVVVVGKVRPWDTFDAEYVLYCDGDLMIGEIVCPRCLAPGIQFSDWDGSPVCDECGLGLVNEEWLDALDVGGEA